MESAIYELTGDDLKVCVDWGRDGKAGVRPTDFTTAPRDGRISLTLKRMKEVKKVEPKKPDEPAWAAEFRKAYGLSDGELVRRVPPPFPVCRAEHFRDRVRKAQAGRPAGPATVIDRDWADQFTVFRFAEGHVAAGWQTTVRSPDEGVPLDLFLAMAFDLPRTRIEADDRARQHRVGGDFVVRVGADPDRLATALEGVLRKECEVPVTVTFRDAEREVFVLAGRYSPKPLDGRKPGEVEVYGEHLADRDAGGGGSGPLSALAAHVEGWVGQPVLLGKVEGAPTSVRWHDNDRGHRTPAADRAKDRDPDAVLAHIAEQTGLALTREKRKIRVLAVDPAGKK